MSEFTTEGRKEGKSLYGEEQYIRDIADSSKWSDHDLMLKGVEYADNLRENEIPRQQKVLDMLLGRVAFEITMRARETWQLEDDFEAESA